MIDKAFWATIDSRIKTQAERIVSEALANLRPGGAHPLLVEVASPTASLTQPVAKIPVPYPAVVTSADIIAQIGETGGSTVVDFRVVRPGEALADAASICAPDYPTRLAADWVHVLPAAGWNVHIEPGSLVLYFIRANSTATSLAISLNLRCL